MISNSEIHDENLVNSVYLIVAFYLSNIETFSEIIQNIRKSLKQKSNFDGPLFDNCKQNMTPSKCTSLAKTLTDLLELW